MIKKLSDIILQINNQRGLLWTEEDKQEFAELIIHECINQALEEKVSEEEIDKEDNIEDRCYLRGNNGGIIDAIIRIKQHFGIEK